MRPIFKPHLVNDLFGDPGLFVDFAFERRALLFDLGDIGRLAPRQILRLSHVFVTHAHMDHFMGFDWLLRISLGREAGVTLFGPPGFIEQVQHKLAAYTWNVVERYPGDFTLVACELQADGRLDAARFRCAKRFVREDLAEARLLDGVLLDEPGFRVRATLLDHATPCLGYLIEEKLHVNDVRRIVALARDADLLFIEAGFLHQDAELAAHKYHLTARQAGLIARAAGVRAVTPFHFSPRYSGREAELREEIDRAFRGE
jgi:ribonuclease Z